MPRYHINLTPVARAPGTCTIDALTLSADTAADALRFATALFPAQVLDAVDTASGESFIAVCGGDGQRPGL